MTHTPNLGLSYIVAAQAQKEVTHNEALNHIDFMAQPGVLSASLTAPPTNPSTGDSYIIAASPTSAWSGHAKALAGYYGGWIYKTPQEGWTVWDRSSQRVLYYTGSDWSLLATPNLSGALTWTPGTLAHGAGVTSAAIAVDGASLGDFVMLAAPYDLQGIQATAYVSAAGYVKIRLGNLSGASVALAAGTWRLRVVKP